MTSYIIRRRKLSNSVLREKKREIIFIYTPTAHTNGIAEGMNTDDINSNGNGNSGNSLDNNDNSDDSHNNNHKSQAEMFKEMIMI